MSMRMLPGSDRMVGGPHECMYHEIELRLGEWRCESVYMHVAYETPRPYGGQDCKAVLDAVNAMKWKLEAADVLLGGAHAPGHPLPGVFTVWSPGYRVDMRAYLHGDEKHLWSEVYRV